MVLVSVVAEEDTYWNHSVTCYDDIETFIKVYGWHIPEDFDELMNIKEALEKNGEYSNNWNFRTYFYAREIPDGIFQNGENIFNKNSNGLSSEQMQEIKEEWEQIQQAQNIDKSNDDIAETQKDVLKYDLPDEHKMPDEKIGKEKANIDTTNEPKIVNLSDIIAECEAEN